MRARKMAACGVAALCVTARGMAAVQVRAKRADASLLLRVGACVVAAGEVRSRGECAGRVRTGRMAASQVTARPALAGRKTAAFKGVDRRIK